MKAKRKPDTKAQEPSRAQKRVAELLDQQRADMDRERTLNEALQKGQQELGGLRLRLRARATAIEELKALEADDG